MRYIIIKQALLIVGAIPFALTAAQTISVVPESVERYAHDMNAAMESSGPVSLEIAFEEGISAAEALERSQLARLDEPTYRKVQHMMIGFWVSREDVILAAPNPDFYLKLAREKGTSADQAFFGALKKTYPQEDRWPVYKEPLTEYGGCTVFDGKTLSGIYEAWDAFQKSYPGRYRGGVRKEVARIEAALESLFVCGNEDEYRRELQSFLKTYPTSPVASKVASRLEAVNSHTSKIRFNCKPH